VKNVGDRMKTISGRVIGAFALASVAVAACNSATAATHGYEGQPCNANGTCSAPGLVCVSGMVCSCCAMHLFEAGTYGQTTTIEASVADGSREGSPPRGDVGLDADAGAGDGQTSDARATDAHGLDGKGSDAGSATDGNASQ